MPRLSRSRRARRSPPLRTAAAPGRTARHSIAARCRSTSGEWEEWGNPNEAKFFDYMLSYSPYNNVRAQPYPSILITAGLHDPRVAFWEPVSCVAAMHRCDSAVSALVRSVCGTESMSRHSGALSCDRPAAAE